MMGHLFRRIELRYSLGISEKAVYFWDTAPTLQLASQQTSTWTPPINLKYTSFFLFLSLSSSFLSLSIPSFSSFYLFLFLSPSLSFPLSITFFSSFYHFLFFFLSLSSLLRFSPSIICFLSNHFVLIYKHFFSNFVATVTFHNFFQQVTPKKGNISSNK